jgi:hypothetical protein
LYQLGNPADSLRVLLFDAKCVLETASLADVNKRRGTARHDPGVERLRVSDCSILSVGRLMLVPERPNRVETAIGQFENDSRHSSVLEVERA